jgi:hypothetical protein
MGGGAVERTTVPLASRLKKNGGPLSRKRVGHGNETGRAPVDEPIAGDACRYAGSRESEEDMEWKDPVARAYARISGAGPLFGEERPDRSLLWPATAVLLTAFFAVAVACGPASNDDLAVGPKRSSRIESAGCESGGGGTIPDDDTCDVTAGTTSATGTTSVTVTNLTTTVTNLTTTGTTASTTTTAGLPLSADAGMPG